MSCHVMSCHVIVCMYVYIHTCIQTGRQTDSQTRNMCICIYTHIYRGLDAEIDQDVGTFGDRLGLCKKRQSRQIQLRRARLQLPYWGTWLAEVSLVWNLFRLEGRTSRSNKIPV